MEKYLMGYQIEALGRMEALENKNKGGFLCMQTGMGKTVTAMALILRMAERRPQCQQFTCIWVPPTLVEFAWRDEWMKHRRIWSESPAFRHVKFLFGSDPNIERTLQLILTTPEFPDGIRSLVVVISRYQLLKPDDSVMFYIRCALVRFSSRIIVDEAHFLHNHKAKCIKALRALLRSMPALPCWLVTATPLETCVSEMATLMDLLDMGIDEFDDGVLFYSKQGHMEAELFPEVVMVELTDVQRMLEAEFARACELQVATSGKGPTGIVRSDKLQQIYLHELVYMRMEKNSQLMVSMRSQEDCPECKVDSLDAVVFGRPHQGRNIRSVLHRMRGVVYPTKRAEWLLAGRQITGSIRIKKKGKPLPTDFKTSPKLEELLRHLQIHRENHSIIFVRWKEETELLHEFLCSEFPDDTVAVMNGDTSAQERRNVMAAMTASGRHPRKLFILSQMIGAEGHNLQVFTRVYILVPLWNICREFQGVARSFRKGQTEDVIVKVMVAKDTLESREMNKRRQKREKLLNMLEDGTLMKFNEFVKSLVRKAEGRRRLEEEKKVVLLDPRPSVWDLPSVTHVLDLCSGDGPLAAYLREQRAIRREQQREADEASVLRFKQRVRAARKAG
jgi:hypothetical protein